MYRSSLRRMILALALGAVLSSPWAAAAESRFTIEPGPLPRAAALPLDWITRVWRLLDQVLTKTGCSIDPHGGCAGSTPTADTGCSIDPNGGCGK